MTLVCERLAFMHIYVSIFFRGQKYFSPHASFLSSVYCSRANSDVINCKKPAFPPQFLRTSQHIHFQQKQSHNITSFSMIVFRCVASESLGENSMKIDRSCAKILMDRIQISICMRQGNSTEIEPLSIGYMKEFLLSWGRLIIVTKFSVVCKLRACKKGLNYSFAIFCTTCLPTCPSTLFTCRIYISVHVSSRIFGSKFQSLTFLRTFFLLSIGFTIGSKPSVQNVTITSLVFE